MIVIGAKGHATEIIDIIKKENFPKVFFFDNISNDTKNDFYGYPIIKKIEDIENLFTEDNTFTLGLGNPILRSSLFNHFKNLGGKPVSLISEKSSMSFNIHLGNGINIMPYCSIFNEARIKDGVLINSYASVHHNTTIGEFSELSPGCRILGNVNVGAMCMIGANTVILPNVNICDNVIIGAGAVVTKDILESGTYVGVPVKKIK